MTPVAAHVATIGLCESLRVMATLRPSRRAPESCASAVQSACNRWSFASRNPSANCWPNCPHADDAPLLRAGRESIERAVASVWEGNAARLRAQAQRARRNRACQCLRLKQLRATRPGSTRRRHLGGPQIPEAVVPAARTYPAADLLTSNIHRLLMLDAKQIEKEFTCLSGPSLASSSVSNPASKLARRVL